MQLDLTELSSYLPLVSCFEFGNVSGKLFPCTEGRVRTRMVPPGTPRAGAFRWDSPIHESAGHCTCSPFSTPPLMNPGPNEIADSNWQPLDDLMGRSLELHVRELFLFAVGWNGQAASDAIRYLPWDK